MFITWNIFSVLAFFTVTEATPTVPTDLVGTTVPNDGSESKLDLLLINRRQHNRPELMERPRRPGSKKKTGRDDDYYEPYWANGDWVFYRKGSTNKPRGYILYTGSTQYNECNQICLKNYQEYGPICAMRYNSRKEKWIYEYQTFRNICYLELANCESHVKMWFPIKKGNCTDGFTPHPTDATAIYSRMIELEKNFPDKGLK